MYNFFEHIKKSLGEWDSDYIRQTQLHKPDKTEIRSTEIRLVQNGDNPPFCEILRIELISFYDMYHWKIWIHRIYVEWFIHVYLMREKAAEK